MTGVNHDKMDLKIKRGILGPSNSDQALIKVLSRWSQGELQAMNKKDSLITVTLYVLLIFRLTCVHVQ